MHEQGPCFVDRNLGIPYDQSTWLQAAAHSLPRHLKILCLFLKTSRVLCTWTAEAPAQYDDAFKSERSREAHMHGFVFEDALGEGDVRIDILAGQKRKAAAIIEEQTSLGCPGVIQGDQQSEGIVALSFGGPPRDLSPGNNVATPVESAGPPSCLSSNLWSQQRRTTPHAA
jgi:hypothetical protein